MPTQMVNGKLVPRGDMFCHICNGTLTEFETECPVCKLRREEVEFLKRRLASLETLLKGDFKP